MKVLNLLVFLQILIKIKKSFFIKTKPINLLTFKLNTTKIIIKTIKNLKKWQTLKKKVQTLEECFQES